MRFVIDIESSDLLQKGLDYTVMPYKLRPDYRIYCIVIRHVDSPAIKTLVGAEITKENLQHVLRKCTELIGHNIVSFDLPVLKLAGLLDYDIAFPGKQTTLFGKPVEITDTLLWSKLLNADRFGGHSLEAWGKRLGNYKGDFKDFSKFTQEMLDYCIQDTAVNVDIFKALEVEQGDHDWSVPYSMEVKLSDLTLKQELFGFSFDSELAKRNLEELTKTMQEIAVKVDPLLPAKQMPKTEASFYVAPKIRFKKDGSISAVFQKFLDKLGAKLSEDRKIIHYEGKEFPVTYDGPLKSEVAATIEDIDVVKSYLLSLGWKPVEVKERDITKNLDKTVKKPPEVLEAIERYIKQTEGSLFKKLRHDHLEIEDGQLRSHLMKMFNETKPQTKYGKMQAQKPIFLPTTPKLTVGVEKEICPNLIELGEKAEFVKDVVQYYTYRHRKNSIAGGVLDEDGEPITGFISAVREDGRIPTPADTLGANTGRYRHKLVCNVPRVTSLYGENMRALFGSGKDLYQLGFDFASLEARIMGHYVIPYKDGEALAEALVAEKPNDIHCYREDTEILTESGWKLFGELCGVEKVAQYNKGRIEFVIPDGIVWQKYKGKMYNDPTTFFSVTPNHRLYYESYTAANRGKEKGRICLAEKFSPSSDKRYILGGVVTNPEHTELRDEEIQLLAAIQADGCLNKDNSGIEFSFVKERKITRLKGILTALGVSYGLGSHFRKGRAEVKIRIPSSELAVKLRGYLEKDKSPKNILLNLSARQLEIFVDEIVHWDGTLTNKNDVVLDTTSKSTVDFVQTACSLIGRKCIVSEYDRKTSFGDCYMYRAYISKKSTPNNFAANKKLVVEEYEGYIGCVSVQSGLVLTRRKGVIVVSGNTLNAKKLGIDRSAAKSFSYAAIYGAQPKKLAKMLGISEEEGKRLFNEYWEAVPALKELKQSVEKEWEQTGKKHIKGLDGRLLKTRSKHSLINVLFQSGGAIAAKWSSVLIAEYLADRNLLGNPFEHTKEDAKVWFMIAYHK